MGRPVTMFFTFWGLNVLRKPEKVSVKKDFISKMFGMMMPRGSRKLGLSKMNMLELLQAVALGKVMATGLQVRAAIAAVQYTHTKRGDGGKKDAADEAARKTAGAGKFSAAPPPKLAAVGGKKV